jgi:hypothetical protein
MLCTSAPHLTKQHESHCSFQLPIVTDWQQKESSVAVTAHFLTNDTSPVNTFFTSKNGARLIDAVFPQERAASESQDE